MQEQERGETVAGKSKKRWAISLFTVAESGVEREHNMRKVIGTIGQGVLGILFLFIFLFNFFAGIVGGIWLLCIGHWRIVLAGFLASLSMPWWWVIVSLPSLGLMALLVLFGEKKSKVGVAIVGLIAGLYDSFLIMGWLALVFTFALIVTWEHEGTLYPMLLFAYSVATSPLLYMASKEPPDSEGTNLTMSIVVIGSILMVVLAFLGVPLIYPLIILCVLMLLRTFLLTALGVSMVPKRKTDYLSDTWMRTKGEKDYGREIDSDTGYTEDAEEYDYEDEYDEDEYGLGNE